LAGAQKSLVSRDQARASTLLVYLRHARLRHGNHSQFALHSQRTQKASAPSLTPLTPRQPSYAGAEEGLKARSQARQRAVHLCDCARVHVPHSCAGRLRHGSQFIPAVPCSAFCRSKAGRGPQHRLAKTVAYGMRIRTAYASTHIRAMRKANACGQCIHSRDNLSPI